MIFQQEIQGFSKTCLTIRNSDLTNRNGDFMGFNQQKYDKSIWWKTNVWGFDELTNSPAPNRHFTLCSFHVSLLGGTDETDR